MVYFLLSWGSTLYKIREVILFCVTNQLPLHVF